MKLNHERQGDVLVLKPEGRIDSRSADEFQDAVRTELTPDITGLVLVFSQTRIDSSYTG